MPPFLKVKTAGIPRWGWILLLTGAAGLGLYMRSRSATREVETDEGERLEAFEGTAMAGGLGAAGLIGPAQGQVMPVEAPYIPEGFVDMFASLTELATKLGANITERETIKTEVGAPTGGGPPETPVEHIPPAPAPAPQCPTNVRNQIQSNKNEMNRLQGEIDNLQGEVAKLTNWIQAHPNAKDKQNWINARNGHQTNIAGKRAKVAALSATNQGLRAIPGCGGQ